LVKSKPPFEALGAAGFTDQAVLYRQRNRLGFSLTPDGEFQREEKTVKTASTVRISSCPE
jgi:hypothetical protein